MPRVTVTDGIEIEYQSLGAGEPILLIMGLGAQMVLWADEFCQLLVEQGYQVIRYDHRDLGLSTWLHQAGAPDIQSLTMKRMFNRPINAPYALEDMAGDAIGILDHLGIQSAHVVGASLGGMIAQTLAIQHPSRIRSITSIMSNTGARRYMYCRPRALKAIFTIPRRTDRQSFIDWSLQVMCAIAGRRYPCDRIALRHLFGRVWERGFNPDAAARQFAAMLATGDRTAGLKTVLAPALVIHGGDDPLVPPAAGRATARALPRGFYREYPGMGHDLPVQLWPRIVEAIIDNARRV